MKPVFTYLESIIQELVGKVKFTPHQPLNSEAVDVRVEKFNRICYPSSMEAYTFTIYEEHCALFGHNLIFIMAYYTNGLARGWSRDHRTQFGADILSNHDLVITKVSEFLMETERILRLYHRTAI